MKNVKRNVSMLLVGSIFMTTTVPQGLQARSLKPFDAEFKQTSASQGIEDAFNKFRYDMTVEWDQRDPYFRDHAEQELSRALESLKAEGESETDILKYVQSNLLDKKVSADYDRLLGALKTQNLSPEQASRVAMDYMEKNYKEGIWYSIFGGVS